MNYNKTVWKDGVYQYPNRYIFEDNLNGTYDISRSLGTITQEQTEVVAELMNNMETGISQSNESAMYQSITGTPNSMICELTEDVLQGKIVRFFAIGNNNGTVTTLNGIPIYRVNSTTPPTIKTGEKVILCYNQANNCWLYQHSAEGNVTPNQVLAGYTFSTSSGLNLIGTMSTISQQKINMTSIDQYFNIPSGYYDAGSYVKSPTYVNIAGDATVNNSNQILSGYKGINGSGLVVGTMNMNEYYTIGTGMTDSNAVLTLTDITKEIKMAIVMYNGEGNYMGEYSTDVKALSIYDPNHFFTGAIDTMVGTSSTTPNYTSFMMYGVQHGGSSPSEKIGFTNINRNNNSTFEDGTLKLAFHGPSVGNKQVQYILFYE